MPDDRKPTSGENRRLFMLSFAKGATVAATDAVFGDAAFGASKPPRGARKPPGASPEGGIPSSAFDATSATKVVDEGGQFALRAKGRVWYGAGDSFVEKVLDAGTHTAGNALFGDPAYRVPKAVYVMDPGIVGPLPVAVSRTTSSVAGPPAAPAPTPTPTTDAMTQIVGVGDVAYAQVAGLPPNRFAQVAMSGTIREAMIAMAAATGYIEYGNDGTPSAGITAAWSGGARYREKFNGSGCGHLDGNMNGAYGFDFETFKVTIDVTPSVVTPDEYKAIVDSWNAHGGWGEFTKWGIHPSSTNIEHGTGRSMPGAFHTYGTCYKHDYHTYIAADRLYDLRTNSCVQIGATQPGGFAGSNWNGNCTNAQSFVHAGKFHLIVGSIVNAYDPANGYARVGGNLATRAYVPGMGAAYGYDTSTYTAVVGDKLYAIRNAPSADDPGRWPAPNAWTIDLPIAPAGGEGGPIHLTRIPSETISDYWSQTDYRNLQYGTSAFDGTLLYIPSRDWSYFLTWNPSTGRCGKIVMIGPLPAPPINGVGAYGRFLWYAERRCFLLINSIGEKLYAFRLHQEYATHAST